MVADKNKSSSSQRVSSFFLFRFSPTRLSPLLDIKHLDHSALTHAHTACPLSALNSVRVTGFVAYFSFLHFQSTIFFFIPQNTHVSFKRQLLFFFSFAFLALSSLKPLYLMLTRQRQRKSLFYQKLNVKLGEFCLNWKLVSCFFLSFYSNGLQFWHLPKSRVQTKPNVIVTPRCTCDDDNHTNPSLSPLPL